MDVTIRGELALWVVPQSGYIEATSEARND